MNQPERSLDVDDPNAVFAYYCDWALFGTVLEVNGSLVGFPEMMKLKQRKLSDDEASVAIRFLTDEESFDITPKVAGVLLHHALYCQLAELMQRRGHISGNEVLFPRVDIVDDSDAIRVSVSDLYGSGEFDEKVFQVIFGSGQVEVGYDDGYYNGLINEAGSL